MGQTRLLLLVLAVVIVSIAVFVGINMFSSGMSSSNFDSLLRDSIEIATDAQLWKGTPQMLGGSQDEIKADPTDYSGATFFSIGYDTDKFPRCYENQNGVFGITPTDEGLRVVGTSVGNQNRVVVMVRGTSDGQVIIQDGPVASLRAVKNGRYLDSNTKTSVYPPAECSIRAATNTFSN